MRTFIRGTDKGNAVLIALILVMALSTVFISFIDRINAKKQYALEYKARVIQTIEQTNMEILNRHAFY